MSMPSLLTSLKAWWAFEEDVSLGHTVMDLSGNGNHLETSDNPLDTANNLSYGERSATRVTGKVGYAIAPRSVYMHDAQASDFKLDAAQPYIWTFAFWLKIPAAIYNSDPAIFGKQKHATDLEYRFSSTDGELLFFPDLMNGGVGVPPEEWCFVVLWLDIVDEKYRIEVRVPSAGTLQAESADLVNAPAANDSPFWLGNHLFPLTDGPHLDEFGFWHRTLTVAERQWLYNSGLGRSFSEIDDEEVVATLECITEDCCPPSLTEYDAATCAVGSVSNPIPTEPDVPIVTPPGCTTPATIGFDPPSGNPAIFPLTVRLYATPTTAVIRYTTDGSTPTVESTLYTTPITVNGPSDVIKAKAFLTGCPDSSTYLGTWSNPSGLSAILCYKGVTEDHAGQWDEFAPNGSPDRNWFLEISNLTGADIEIDHFELYQVNSLGVWDTGQVWSTIREIVPPPPEWNQTQVFQSYPLLFFDSGGVQVNTAYGHDFETIAGPGSISWNLYGQPVTEIREGDYFNLVIFFTNGMRLYGTAHSGAEVECGTEPPPCPVLADPPVLTPGCLSIKVDITVPAPSRPWEIYVALGTGSETFSLAFSGTGSGAITRTLSGLSPSIIYGFYYRINVSADYPHCPTWISSPISHSQPVCEADAVLLAGTSEGCAGDTVTLSYTTICSSGTPTIALTSGNPSGIDSPTFPVSLTPNISGTLEVEFDALASGTYEFTLTAPGKTSPATGLACPSAVAVVEIEIVTTPPFGTIFQGPAALKLRQYKTASDAGLATILPSTFVDYPFTGTGDCEPSFYCSQGDPGGQIFTFWDLRLLLASDRLSWLADTMPLVVNGGGTRAGYLGPSENPFYINNSTQLLPNQGNFVLSIIRAADCFPNAQGCQAGYSLWRGSRCAADPRGEYISDAFKAMPDGEVLTVPSNRHIYSILVL